VSTLLESFRQGGPLMVPLAGLCVAISFWLAVLYPRLRGMRAAAPRLLRWLESADGDLRVRDWATRRRGPLARILRHGTGGRTGDEVRSRMAEARDAEIPKFERELGVLKAMVAAAPLLGLLGTVRGMIETFWVLSTRGVSSLNLLSSGISEALLTTQVGLIVALPGLVGAHAVRRRLEEVEVLLDRLATRLAMHPGGEA
jgi:biopolymer transport protein ExbB